MIKNKKQSKKSGFTLVELVIVVVVIAILAAIGYVAYGGAQDRAREAVLSSDLTSAAELLNVDRVRSGGKSFPADMSDTDNGNGLPASADTIYYYTVNNSVNPPEFCLTGHNGMIALHITHEGVVGEGVCAGDPEPVANTDDGGTPATMQTFSDLDCGGLTTFTGFNTEDLITLEDSRGLIESYTVGRLADGNCWMLDNLKLGDTSGTITLTPEDSDVSSDFTLPQAITSSLYSQDDPMVLGPVSGDTGSGATDYGYLYNWSAATAGETTASMPAGSGNAAHSICPLGWRLPTGGETTSSDFAQLDISFGGSGDYAGSGQSNIAKWQSAGIFKGTLSGYWSGNFTNQGTRGYLWSASAWPSDYSEWAFSANYRTTNVYPGNDWFDRSNGFGVRCLFK